MKDFLQDHGEEWYQFVRYSDGVSVYSNHVFDLIVQGTVTEQLVQANDVNIDTVYDLINEEWID